MTPEDVFTEARHILHDITGTDTYRYDPVDMLRWLNLGRQELYKRRPDLWLAADNTMTALSELTTADYETTLTEGLDQMLRLAHFIAYRALSGESADEQEARQAMEQKAMFDAAI